MMAARVFQIIRCGGLVLTWGFNVKQGSSICKISGMTMINPFHDESIEMHDSLNVTVTPVVAPSIASRQ